MKLREVTASLLVFAVFLGQSKASAGMPSSIGSEIVQSTNQAAPDEKFEQRRQHFNSGRRLLLDKHVPFEPEDLLRDERPQQLKDALQTMPEMKEVRYETAPLTGAYLADTIYLPENVILSGHTVILANNIVFEGKNPVIRGPFDLHIFPSQPIAVLGAALAATLHARTGMMNVSLTSHSLPSYRLFRNVNDSQSHTITFDTSGPAPARRRPPGRTAPTLRSAAWNIGYGTFQSQDTSGNAGNNGTSGTPGAAGTAGQTPVAGLDGDCSDVANASNDGRGGTNGTNGQPAGAGGAGSPGGTGGDAGAITANIADGDFNTYVFKANGGAGGAGGEGGNGGVGGNAGNGSNGGKGVACGCSVGNGGTSGKGGDGGAGSAAGDGGAGGPGGNGSAISVSLPSGSPGANTFNTGGAGGAGGAGGSGGRGGFGGAAGTPGSGATACGQIGTPGIQNFPGNSAASGTSGNAGPNGSPGLSGPPPSITFRTKVSGGCGALCVPDPCLNGAAAGLIGAFNSPSCSPIIIDTTGKGFQLTSAEDGVQFDIEGSGRPVQIAWTAIGSGNAFLVLDRNHNGVIDNGTELFGNFTAQPKSPQPNGFLALAEFDKPENGGNGDGITDQRDSVYFQLRLWIDENHDGMAQPGELHTLLEMGVQSLSLDYRESGRTDEFGNQFRFKAKIKDLKGADTGRSAYDVFLLTK